VGASHLAEALHIVLSRLGFRYLFYFALLGFMNICLINRPIQNTTIWENICFGRPFEEKRYWKAVRDSCLGPDFEMLPHGDMTEVGKNGISLSGGQKQRVNICRAIYCDTEIQIFDVREFPSLENSCFPHQQLIGSSFGLGRSCRQESFRKRAS
jgi:hypothetical protein